MSGAGISTSAGIPDFRSPETGLYANLARLNLPYAEAVFSINYFQEHPEAFYTLAQELYPGKWRPTITHVFIALLHKKGLLLKHFTQNIDCLDREAGVPGDKVIEAHGSFATSRCIECKLEYPNDEMLQKVEKQEIPRCKDEKCNGLVKPDIVFFGEALPAAFFEGQNLPRMADLVIVMGSSLSVAPFSQLPGLTSEGVPRLLINMEAVGDLGSRRDDVLELGDCDTGVRKLAEACGWLDELEEMWDENGRKFGIEPGSKAEKVEKSKDEMLEDEIRKITQEVEDTLNITQKHTDKVMGTSTLPSQPAGHSRVKSVEEWKAEFQANYEQNIKDDTAVAERENIAEKARLASASTPPPGWNKEKISTVGGATYNAEDESDGEDGPVSLTSLLRPQDQASQEKTPQPTLTSSLSIAPAQALEKENHGFMLNGTALPDWNEEKMSTEGGVSYNDDDEDKYDEEDDGRISLASLMKK